MASTTSLIATATVLASTTSVASSTAQVSDVSPWVSYCIDFVFLLAFLYVLFFTKAENKSSEELTPEEMPNELEQIIRTDPEDEANSEETAAPEKETEETSENE